MIKNLDNDLFCSADNKAYKELEEAIENCRKENGYCLAISSNDKLTKETQAFIKVLSSNIMIFIKNMNALIHKKFDMGDAYFCCMLLQTSVDKYQELTDLNFDYEINVITPNGVRKFKGEH